MTPIDYTNDEEWEAICSRCGCCCWHPTLKEPCPYLDFDPKNGKATCKVYDFRFEVRWYDSQGGSHRCFRISEALDKGTLPEGCCYRTLRSFNSL